MSKAISFNTFAIKKSEKDAGSTENELYPISKADQSLSNGVLHNCKLTCFSATVNTLSDKVTTPVSVKSQVASVTNPDITAFFKVVLYFTFGITVTPLFAIVFALKTAAATYFPAASPA